jgi:hypothetical protein
MNQEQATTYLQALMATVTVNVIVPLIAFALIFGMFVWVLFTAQRRSDFDASEFLRDDKGKLSSARLFAFVACAAHTWALMVETINARLTTELVAVYAITWSGSLVLLEAIKAWKGRNDPQ